MFAIYTFAKFSLFPSEGIAWLYFYFLVSGTLSGKYFYEMGTKWYFMLIIDTLCFWLMNWCRPSKKKAKRNSSTEPNISSSKRSFCLLHLYPIVLHSELIIRGFFLNKLQFFSPGLKVPQSRRALNQWKFLLWIVKKLYFWFRIHQQVVKS